ncbi:MAG: acetate--CoA ligase family protein [Betaproteobacteria bacterium]
MELSDAPAQAGTEPTRAAKPLGELDAKRLLRRQGIRVPDSGAARTRDEAGAIAARLGYPVVLKLVAPQLAHKTEAGGVALDLRGPEEVACAFDALQQAARRLGIDFEGAGALVERMAPPGVEMIVAVRRDPALGWFLVLGAGGRLAELLGPPVIRTLPLDEKIAFSMAREARVFPLLEGYRGSAPRDIAGLVELMLKLADLAISPDLNLEELELNPVIVCDKGSGAWAADAYGSTRAETTRDDARAASAAAARAMALDPAVRTLIRPDSVAVIGASADPDKFGNWLIRYLQTHRFPGRLYPVNPNRAEILGLPCFPTIEAVPGPVDVACFVVPARAAVPAVKAAAQCGVRAGIVFASGFAEAGSHELEASLLDAARSGGLRLCGPNTIGLIRPGDSICLTYSNTVAQELLRDGPVAVISQSGAIGGSIVARLWEEGIGTSVWVSAGNETDLEVADYLLYAAEDAKTRAVAVFLEGVKNARRFRAAIARCIAAGKPVIAYKSGTSQLGARAVETHTGKLAGDAALYRAFFRDCGVIEAGELTEVAELARALTMAPLPRGNRVASLSPSGGAGSIVADECAAAGLRMARLSPQTASCLRQWIGAGGHPDNPVDVGGLAFQQPEAFGKILGVLLDDPALDGVVVALTTISEAFAAPLAACIVPILPEAKKPILAAWLGAASLAPESHARLSERLPLYRSVRGAARAMAALARWRQVKTAAATGSE